MCGIVGQARADGAPVEPATLERMCAALEHRGPDSRGVHVADGAGIGIQRLRVIDLVTGDQPIFNEDRSVAVVLNGEIYNFEELRGRLQRSGHSFATQGDTEVIAHLYEEEGPACVRSLHGMFGLAIWDAKRRQLVLARDRVGKKPLFYSHRDGALSFASELAALMQDEEIPRDLDHQALDAYLAYRYIPAPLSVFSAVRKLPPASTLVFRDGQVSIDRYWKLDYGEKREVSDPREIDEELREQIRRAVRRRMIADVPLGAFLSGGIDSSAVVAAMAEASSEPVRTFSIGFEAEEFNELPRARRIAQEFATDHHEFVIEPNAVELLPTLVAHYGEPYADASALPSFYLAELTRRHVTVALNGDGGDESFAGYQRYVANLLLARFERLPSPLRSGLASLGGRLPPSARVNGPVRRAQRMTAAMAMDPVDRYTAYVSSFDGLDRESLYTDGFRELVGRSLVGDFVRTAWAESSAQHRLDLMLDVDVNTYLPGDLLVKMDIATMAYGLEARSPLLDPEFMQFAASLPPEHKVDGLEKKAGLRRALRGWIPQEILDGPKRGFEVPLARWFRNDLREYARDVLLDPVARERGYFEPAHVERILDRHAAGVEDNSRGIWSLLMFELWHQRFVDERLPAQAQRALA